MKTKANNIELSSYENKLIIPCTREFGAKVIELQGKSKNGLDVDITAHSDGRSLNSNSYSWVLTDKIAKALGSTEEEIHYEMITRYGVRYEKFSIIHCDTKEAFEAETPYYKFYTERKFEDILFYVYHTYKPSRKYNSKEMSVFIEGIVSEAKELDIETLTPNELQQMNERSYK